MIDPQFRDTATHGLGITKVSLLDPLETGGDTDLGRPIPKLLEPGAVFLGRQHGEHGATVTQGLHLVKATLPFIALDERMQSAGGKASVCTMHLANGLEFRAVVVMMCDDEVIPSHARIEQVTDASDLAEVYATERHLVGSQR